MRSIFPRSFSEKALSKEGGGKANGSMHLYLNVYDLTPANNYLYWFGIGVFHSGIEVHGMEYTFGAHDYATSGVFEVEPKSCPGFIFRRCVARHYNYVSCISSHIDRRSCGKISWRCLSFDHQELQPFH